MLTGLQFWHLVQHILPVYIIVIVAYVLQTLKVIQPVHAPGIVRWVAVMGVPAYIFYLLAFNDPYQISLRLVGADALQKAVALILGCLWWKFSKTGKIDHVISFFMLATLPNTVLIGDALLEPLYGVNINGKVVTIIFLQCLIWYNLCIALYELRIVLLEMEAAKVSRQAAAGAPWQQGSETLGNSARKSTVSIADVENGLRSYEMTHSGFPHLSSNPSPVLERTLSAPARVSFSKVVPIFHEPHWISKVDEGLALEDLTGSPGGHAPTRNQYPMMSGQLNGRGGQAVGDLEQEIVPYKGQSGMIEVMDPAAEPQKSESRLDMKQRFLFVCLVVGKVLNRLKYSPITYSSIIGFVYSLFAFKYHWTMPYTILTSVELISQGAVGMAIFVLGMTWASSGRLISCGWKRMTYGMFVRFLVGPIIMVVTALIFGLKGQNFKFAVLQAVIPQGVISFVLAKEYNLNANEFSTAVIFQLIVFLPVVVAYYFILDSA